MLVLGKRKPPGSATARRADPQEAGFADRTGTFLPLVRLSRPHRETTAVPAAGPTPLGLAAAGLAAIGLAAVGLAAVGQNTVTRHKEDNMLSVTESDDRITVTCSCGCYSLSAHKPADTHDSLVRCLMCGARARLADLMARHQTGRDTNIDTETS